MILCSIYESNDCHNPAGPGGGQFCGKLGTDEGWHGYLRKSGLVPVKDIGGTTWWTKPKAAKRFNPKLTDGTERNRGIMTWGGAK